MTGLIVLAVIGTIGYLVWLRLGPFLLRRQAEEIAAVRGWQVITERRHPPSGFSLPLGGTKNTVDVQLVDPVSGVRVFRHRYNVSGQEQSTRLNMHVLVPLPCNAPYVQLRPPSIVNRLSKRIGLDQTEFGDTDFASRTGIRDISTGQARLDETFQVASDDERFAMRLLDTPMGQRLVSKKDHARSRLTFEFSGAWLLVSGPDFDFDHAASFLDLGNNLLNVFPEELTATGSGQPDHSDPFT